VTCAVEARHRCRAAAEVLAADPRTTAVDAIEPAVGPRSTWVLELVIEGDAVGPAMLAALGRHHLSVVDVSPQGPDHVTVVAEVAD